MPGIFYYISHSKEPVTADSLIWPEPIPLRLDTLRKSDGESVSHAAYFQAARAFLEADSFKVLTRAASRLLDRDVKAADVDEIRICLEKHGEFYHPARIETSVYQQKLSFVLNVAVSKTGRRFIEKEFKLLNRLNTEQPHHYLPQAYGFGQASGADRQNFTMFLGQWFEGYHEFHISTDPIDQKAKIKVWDDIRGRFFLSSGQTRTLYAQVAEILTAYYNLESFEGIFAWHHAAGDFIVKAENEKLELKLVTVRQYEAIFEIQPDTQSAAGDPGRILQALLIFFLNLSIHIRLDRLDGIGEMVWSNDIAVEAALIGFLDALSMKPDVAVLPDSPLACFVAYLLSCTAEDLIDLVEAIINRFNPKMPGLALVRKNIGEHVGTLYAAIQKIMSMD